MGSSLPFLYEEFTMLRIIFTLKAAFNSLLNLNVGEYCSKKLHQIIYMYYWLKWVLKHYKKDNMQNRIDKHLESDSGSYLNHHM
jgi:hypothetical protein